MARWKYRIDFSSAVHAAQEQDLDARTAARFLADRLRREAKKLPGRVGDEFLDLAERLDMAEEMEEVDDVLSDVYDYADSARIWLDAESDPRDWHPPKRLSGPPKRKPYRYAIDFQSAVRAAKEAELDWELTAESLAERMRREVKRLPLWLRRDFREIAELLEEADGPGAVDSALDELYTLAETERVLLWRPGSKDWAPHQRFQYFEEEER